MKTDDKALVNSGIRSASVILIDEEGKNRGQIPTKSAIKLAQDKGYDLVAVSNISEKIPVCKIMDYGKMRYEKSKGAKKSQKSANVVKEIRVSPTIAEHDLEIKRKKVLDFLVKGFSVTVVMLIKGRQMSRKQDFIDWMDSFSKEFSDKAKVSSLDAKGKTVSFTLTPLKQGK